MEINIENYFLKQSLTQRIFWIMFILIVGILL